MSRVWWNRWRHRSVRISQCMLRSMTRNSAHIFPDLWPLSGTCWSTLAHTWNMTRWTLLHLWWWFLLFAQICTIMLSFMCAFVYCVLRVVLAFYSRPNNIRGWNVRPSVGTSIRLSVHPSSSKKFFQCQWNLVCRYKSMTGARRYAIWPNPRSGSWGFWSSQNCTSPCLSPSPFAMAAGKWPPILKLEHNI